MVGLFHIGAKGSPSRATRSTDTARPMTPPPPPYAQNGNGSTYFATETTTTTTQVVTTTQTTTHFFSLPLWRRRTQQPTQTASPTPKSSYADELGVVRGSPSKVLPARDKDLPPTPPSENEAGPSTRSSSHLSSSQRDSRRGDNSPSRSSTHRITPPGPTLPSILPLAGGAIPESASQGTAALARAALGLGLPPLMFNTVPDPEPSENTNTVTSTNAETRPDSVPSTSLSSSASMRRAKSFQKGSEEEQAQSYTALREQRRGRGLSLGPLLATSEVVKEEKPAERKSLSRKSSFWSRKRNDSRAPPPVITPSANQFLAQPSLPSFQPVSPFNMDTSMGEPAGPRPDHLEPSSATDLRRRHSEKLLSSRSARPSLEHDRSEESASVQGRRRQRTKRPQTASTPTGGPRAQSSFFPGSVSITTEPAQMAGPTEITPTGNTSPPHTSTPPISVRPRSSTNPPLLHRLSINLFGSSPNPSPVANHASADAFTRSPSTSFSSSSRPSLTKSSPKASVEIPRPRHDEESPEGYLQRLMEAVSKAEVASVLAASCVVLSSSLSHADSRY